jgi:hypothetical protein
MVPYHELRRAAYSVNRDIGFAMTFSVNHEVDIGVTRISTETIFMRVGLSKGCGGMPGDSYLWRRLGVS